jgi:4-amino-4-deoxy-L-arabinose transferase-like glycosyltransferase
LLVGGSGYHRDELYFLEASKHLAWGYVDQPPVSVALVGLSRALFGDAMVGLRVFPALADAATVFLTALIARELGGQRFAQTLAALAVALSPFLIAGHLAGPTIYDLTAWSLVSWLVIRIVRTGAERLWLAVGLVVGVALLTKETILFLAGGLVVGSLANRQGRFLRSPWLWLGAAIALLFWMPNLVWQAQHGWPTIEMSRNLQREHSGVGYAASFVAIQLLLPGWWAAPVWIAGLWSLWREDRFRSYRAFAVAYALLFVLLLVFVGDRPYYLAGLYPTLLAAGSVITSGVVAGSRRFLSVRPPRRRILWRSSGAAFVWVLVLGVLSLPLSLPILPARVLATVPLQHLNYNLGEVVGWPQLTARVASVYRSLPGAERAVAAVVTENYGEAGAIDRYGPPLGLPGAFSGHNSYWWWGPPAPARGVTIAIGFEPDDLTPYFRTVRIAGRFRSPYGIDNDEDGTSILVCTGQRAPWPSIWRDFRHYG